MDDRLFVTEYPWAVAIRAQQGEGICTGALITASVVITAAHCARTGVDVLFGSASRASARRVAVREAIRHPRYQREPMRYDLGLLRLVRPVRVRPVPVALRSESWSLLRPGAGATILGWGRDGSGAPHPDRLHRALISFDAIHAGEAYLAFVSARGGPCGGDSGGPLLMADTSGKPLLVGVASVTETGLCRQGGGLAIYTDVAALRSFLEEQVPELPERLPPLVFPADGPGGSP